MLEKNWRDLIRPKALDVDKESLTSAYGKFVAKPLERGFFNTHSAAFSILALDAYARSGGKAELLNQMKIEEILADCISNKSG
mgnify:CR=1 FL=1